MDFFEIKYEERSKDRELYNGSYQSRDIPAEDDSLNNVNQQMHGIRKEEPAEKHNPKGSINYECEAD